MKQYAILLSMFLLVLPGVSQVVIDQSDMPVPGDTLRVSVTNDVPVDFSLTAMDTTWDFSMLQALSQRIDTFVSVTSVPAEYQLFFVLLGGANLASPRNASFFPGIPVSDGFSFFRKSAGAYEDLGTAFKVQGIPFPAKYDIPDKYYAFPMNPGNTWSSVATFSVTIPGMIHYSTERDRSSVVDGWGTLVTPYGSFAALRVKSEILQHDSVYIDSLGAGFPFNRVITEYKWLGKNQGIPLLTVSQEGSMETAVYRDFYRMSAQPLTVDLGPDTSILKGQQVTLSAQVSGGTPPYQVWWNTLDSGQTLTVTVEDTRTYSVIVIDAVQNFGFSDIVVNVKYAPGIGEQQFRPVVISPNPSDGRALVEIPSQGNLVTVGLYTMQGVLVGEVTGAGHGGRVPVDFSGVEDGIYLLRVSDRESTWLGKMVIGPASVR